MMFKKLHVLFLVVACAAGLQAQVTILDFETPATSTTFQYFGSAIEGQLSTTIANPNATGINTSATVLQFSKPANSQTWAGAYSNPIPATAVDVSGGGIIKVKVHSDHVGNLALKLEASSTGGDDWILQQPITTINEWVELSFDPNLPAIEGTLQPAVGNIYERIVLFFDFGTAFPSDQTYYLDDIVVEPVITCSPILDFEDPATTTNFQYFGSSLEGQVSSNITNPNATGINTSATVLQFSKPANSQTWAGAFTNPLPATAVDVTSGGLIKVKVHSDHVGNLALKLEASTTGGADWILQQPITTINEWVELSFDPNLPAIEGTLQPAAGHIYERIVLFFDFGTAFPSDQTYYLDDIVVCSSGGTPTADVTFQVNMNDYAGTFTTVNVSGEFNEWSSESNPLSDDDGDGVYSATLNLPVGLYEYKFTLDNGAAQENLAITGSCVQVTVDGADIFVNRKLALAGDEELAPVCFNSCYDCGESVSITYELGMNGATPDPGGVYLAGGPEFGAPNLRFRMYDNDMDGVFSVTIERETGYGGYYTFTNGPCGDFSCKENIVGLPCARPENFNDRILLPVQQDTVVASCFSTCATASDCTSVGTTDLAGPGSWVEVVPSLASNEVRVLFHELVQSNAGVRIMDITGKTVWQQQWRIAPGQVQLQIADWQPGMYFISIENGNRRATGRFVKM